MIIYCSTEEWYILNSIIISTENNCTRYNPPGFECIVADNLLKITGMFLQEEHEKNELD